MIDRRELLARAAAGAGMLTLPGLRQAQAQGRAFRILMLTFRGETEVERGFRDYLAAEGTPVEIISRDVAQNIANLAPILKELPTLAPDLIYTWGTPLTLGVVGPYDAPDPALFVRDKPVVFALVAAPLQAKIVDNLAHPGRNVTGAVHVVPTGVQLRAMQSYMPFQKVGVLYSPNEQNSIAIVEQVRTYCAGIGAEVVTRTFRTDAGKRPTADGVEDLIKELKDDGAQWLYLLPDTFLGTIYDRVAPAALAVGLPTFGAAELAVRKGGALIGLVSRYYSVGQLAGAKANQILVQGTPPGDIPIETLKRFSLIINIRVAKTLGIYPPIEMLNYAEVISS